MRNLDKEKAIVRIEFEGEEIKILENICDTNVSVPRAVRNNTGREELETAKFLRGLKRILTNRKK